jgi:hypothetical protein
MTGTIDELAEAANNDKPMEVGVAKWGGTDGVNCYAWAANCKKPSNSKPDPGKRSSYNPKGDNGFDAARLVEGAKKDGMIHKPCKSQNDPPSPSDNHYLVALYLSTDGSDHHWYRKEPKTGRWTHKPGPQGIRNFGIAFKILPKKLMDISHDYGSTRTNYKFVAYFEVPEAGIAL